MHSNDYEAAFGRFLEQTEYDEAEDALFSLVRVISCPSRESCSASALPIFPSPTITIRMVSTPFSLIRSEFATNIVPRRPLFCNQPPVKPLFRNVPSCPMREKAVY